MALPAPPLPPLGRMMVFVDGENLVARYQALLDEGRSPASEIRHRTDTYVWSPRAVWPGLCVVQRATYYTYSIGSEELVLQVANEIKELTFTQYSVHGQNLPVLLGNAMFPVVFHKAKKARNAKGVDIQLTVDVLSNVYQDNVDVVYLVAGDGDYAPLITE